MKASNIVWVSLIIAICINRTFSLPVVSNLMYFLLILSINLSYLQTRMRVCVQSSDPNRLQSQCVYCNNRLFLSTVRQCTRYVSYQLKKIFDPKLIRLIFNLDISSRESNSRGSFLSGQELQTSKSSNLSYFTFILFLIFYN